MKTGLEAFSFIFPGGQVIKILKYDIEVKDICGHFKLGVLLGHKIYNRKWREFYSSLVEDILVGDVLNKTKACALTHLYLLRQIRYRRRMCSK